MVTAAGAGLERKSIFASRSFRQYYIGQAFSYLGDGLRVLTVPLLVFYLTRSALSTGLGFVFEIAPFALLGPIAGSFADRMDRRKLMIACDFLRFLVMVMFAVTYMTHTLTVPMLYGGLILLSISAGFFLGGQASSIPYLLGPSQTTPAISNLIAVESASNLIAPVLGGALMGLWGPEPALLLNAATYLISQFSLARISTLGPDHVGGLPDLRELRDDFLIGYRWLFGDRTMRAMSLSSWFMNFFGFGTYAILVPYLKRSFGATPQNIGVFFAITAVGSIAGSLLAAKINDRWPFGRMIIVSFALDALFFLPFPFVHSIWVAAVIWGCSNVGASFELSQIIGWRMRITPQELIGRVIGCVRQFVLSGLIPGVLAMGWIADHVSGRAAMMSGAFGFLIVAAIFVCLPTIRREAR